MLCLKLFSASATKTVSSTNSKTCLHLASIQIHSSLKAGLCSLTAVCRKMLKAMAKWGNQLIANVCSLTASIVL